MGRERKAPVAIVLRPVAGSVTTNAAGAVALLGKRMLAAARGPDHRPILEMLMVSIDIRAVSVFPFLRSRVLKSRGRICENVFRCRRARRSEACLVVSVFVVRSFSPRVRRW
jgi:hypothetical protein